MFLSKFWLLSIPGQKCAFAQPVPSLFTWVQTGRGTRARAKLAKRGGTSERSGAHSWRCPDVGQFRGSSMWNPKLLPFTRSPSNVGGKQVCAFLGCGHYPICRWLSDCVSVNKVSKPPQLQFAERCCRHKIRRPLYEHSRSNIEQDDRMSLGQPEVPQKITGKQLQKYAQTSCKRCLRQKAIRDTNTRDEPR